MQKIVKTMLTLLCSVIGSWIGAAVDHNNWFGAASTILGIVGFVAGIWLARRLDDYIEM